MATSPQFREMVGGRSDFRCEYCRSPEWVSPASFSVEHIIPTSAGGAEDPGNLAFSCQGCNNHKYTATTGPDPSDGAVVPLFHPRKELWSTHFSWSESKLEIVGDTPTGRATVTRLKLNRPNLLNLRRILLAASEHPPEP